MLHLYLQFYLCGSHLYLGLGRVGNNSFENRVVGLLLKVIYDFLKHKVFSVFNSKHRLSPTPVFVCSF